MRAPFAATRAFPGRCLTSVAGNEAKRWREEFLRLKADAGMA